MYFFVIISYRCNHDFLSDYFMRYQPPKKFEIDSLLTDNKFKTENRKPIRIYFDTSPLMKKDQTCSKVDEIIDGKKCTANDIMNKHKLYVVRETLNEIRKFFSQIIQVTPYNKEYIDKKIRVDSDLVVHVYVKPFGNSFALANAGCITKNLDPEDYGRPIRGRMTINPSRIPEKPQNYYSDDRQFFSILAHEMMHILAFSKELFPYWVQRDGSKYQNIIKNVKRIDGATQKFLNTPKLTEWVNNRFGVEDEKLINLGLELEDGGGEGTASSHPNSRLFFTDIMQGKTFEVQYFSPIIFNSLYDSGWYDVNFSMQEPLVFLDPKFNNNYPTQDVLIKPPTDSFPSYYFCENDGDAACFYDYSAKALCNLKNEKELQMNESSYPKDTSWVNPYNSEQVGIDELLDFTPIYTPYSSCRVLSKNDILGIDMLESFGAKSICAMSTLVRIGIMQRFKSFPACYQSRCKAGGKLYLVLEDGEHLCTRPGRKIYVRGRSGYVICPPASIACANQVIEPGVSISHAAPDRGPRDGGNYISFVGTNLSSLRITAMKLGNLNLMKYRYKIVKDRIIVLLPKNLHIDNSIISVPQNLYISAVGYPDSTIESVYTFTDILYNSSAKAAPCALLVLLTAILAAAV